jgi:O-methyltransferase
MQQDLATAPEQNYRILRRILPKKLQPLFRGIRRRWQRRKFKLEEPFHSVFPYTQVEVERLYHLTKLSLEIDEARVPGDIVECGVLDGGSAALLAASTRSDRKIHLFDAWKGLPATASQDGDASRKWVGDIVGSHQRVKRIFNTLGVERSRIVFHPGWFQDTFPDAKIDSISLIHIDCDFYEPTLLSLETWYPKLSPGGFIQIDDYSSYLGCRIAVDEFIQSYPHLTLQTSGTNHVAYYIQKPASNGLGT